MSYHVILYHSIYSVAHRLYQTTSRYNVLLLAIEYLEIEAFRIDLSSSFVKDLRGSMAVMTHKSTVRFSLEAVARQGYFSPEASLVRKYSFQPPSRKGTGWDTSRNGHDVPHPVNLCRARDPSL